MDGMGVNCLVFRFGGGPYNFDWEIWRANEHIFLVTSTNFVNDIDSTFTTYTFAQVSFTIMIYATVNAFLCIK